MSRQRLSEVPAGFEQERQRTDVWIWPSWLVGLLSGEDHCKFSGWVKANFQYTKRPEDPEDQARLREYNANHERALQAEAERLTAEGYTVSLEDANAFAVRGSRATIAGKVDLIAVKDGQGELVDIKTGRPWQKHLWQVGLYLAFGVERIPGLSKYAGALRGRVHYPGRQDELLSAADAERMREPIVKLVLDLAASTPPVAAPSAKECNFCPVAMCPYRYKATEAPAGRTPGF